MADDGQQTHDDIPDIPDGVEVPDSSGSLILNLVSAVLGVGTSTLAVANTDTHRADI